MSPKSIYVLPLSDNGHPKPSLGTGNFLSFPVPDEPYIVRFVVFSTCSITNEGVFWCNVPKDGAPYDRNKFYPYPIHAKFHKEFHIDVHIDQPGVYAFYTTYRPMKDNYFALASGAAPNDVSVSTGFSASTADMARETYRGGSPASADLESSHKFYFNVQAGFQRNGKPLPLNSLSIESVISKWMGPVSSWDEKMAYISQKGYNMVHFTPLQQRGESNSPYSIFDQLAWDPECFPNGEPDVEQLVASMESKHQLLSLTDVVLNHTANNSEWLLSHPEAGYSKVTAPHLSPAIDLDTGLLQYSDYLAEHGPTEINGEGDLNVIADGIKNRVFQSIRLWEYYIVNVDETVDAVLKVYDSATPANDVPSNIQHDIKALAKFVVDEAAADDFDAFGKARFSRKLKIDTLAGILKSIGSADAAGDTRSIVNEVNLDAYREYDNDITTAHKQLLDRIRYTRMDYNGPRLGKITKRNPLTEPYFTRITGKDGNKYELANNGWIWAGNPLQDFASAESKAYLRREVIVWGDCVKLRFGSKREDSEWLWDHMANYVQLLAKHFHGFRIDNCHSTPIHVGEYLLDKARLVRPNLYVVAELFTGSENMDKLFVERLGLTSLIREAMQAWTPDELSALMHKFGGRPIGSFSQQALFKYDRPDETSISSAEIDKVYAVRSSSTHALFMDCTHDNEMPAQKRQVEDTLPNAALVAMCACATGSVMGYDECYPKLLEIVTEHRQYTFGGGISEIKGLLNKMHEEMGMLKTDEMYLHHEGQFITCQRVNPRTGAGYFLAARTKFYDAGPQTLSDIKLEGTSVTPWICTSLVKCGDFKDDDKYLNAIPTKVQDLEAPSVSKDGAFTIVKLPEHFPQGSICLFKTQIDRADVDDNYYRTGCDEAVKELNLNDLNIVLYKADGEERDAYGDGVYTIPNYGPLTYAGLEGWMIPLLELIKTNNLGHPICDHLRDGQWPLDYTVARLRKYSQNYPQLTALADWLDSRFEKIRHSPSFTLPRYFALVILNAYAACRKRALSLFPPGVGKGTFFLHNLGLVSIQMIGETNSASLVPFKKVPSMAAGLPHFSQGFMRCWGRDVFLSVRGLMLATGRLDEAKQHILGFAATLKHGLIPNLLDSGNNPRYNARDAAWFFLQAVQDYCEYDKSTDILHEAVKRRFPLDDTWVAVDDSRAFAESSTLGQIVYEILARHAKGIQFREANAGPNLDSQMTDEGFNQKIYVDWETGIIFGGNQWNCGTWMDKMGESTRAGNKGYPGTPRDGAAVEITGLLKSALRWVNKLHREGSFKWDAVENQHGDTISLKEWEEKLQSSFERCYWVPLDAGDDHKYDIDSSIVNRRGIYKDIYKSGKPYEDYQLRPNQYIAMCVAPELFTPENALRAVAVGDSAILGPYGMRTLDPSDYNYRPYYENSVDSDDFSTAKGRNYHQGPEWVWCRGFFLKAFLIFDIKNKIAAKEKTHETFQQINKRLLGCKGWIRESPWAGLTELTNKDGALCRDSSPTQCWSAATLIEIFEDARKITG